MSFIRPAAPARCVSATLAANFALQPLPAPAEHGLAVLVLQHLNPVLAEAAAALRAQGVEVHAAASTAVAAGRLAAERRFGVLLADIGLLEGDGLGLAARLLAEQEQATAVELVLAHGPEEAAEELVDAVQRALAKAAARRAGLPVPGRRPFLD